jgi:hypothetical protein
MDPYWNQESTNMSSITDQHHIQSEPTQQKAFFGNSFNMALLVTSVHVTDDEVVLVRYVAEQDDFDKYLPKAKQVIKSISPVNST